MDKITPETIPSTGTAMPPINVKMYLLTTYPFASHPPDIKQYYEKPKAWVTPPAGMRLFWIEVPPHGQGEPTIVEIHGG
jgi:hypothetical protein